MLKQRSGWVRGAGRGLGHRNFEVSSVELSATGLNPLFPVCHPAPLQRTPAVYCVRLARALVDDYCNLLPGSIQTLKQIFSASPRFCCQFITSVTALYDLSSGKCFPPVSFEVSNAE